MSHSTWHSRDPRFRKVLSSHDGWNENIENITEKETGAAGCGVNVNCPIKSSYAWQKYVVNAALRRPGNDAERHYFSFKFAPHPSISRV